MRTSSFCLLLLLALPPVAAARAPARAPRHYPEQLSLEQIRSAVQEARARLPKVNKRAMKRCTDLPRKRPRELLAAAACLRKAGSLGMAISLWNRLLDNADGAVVVQALTGLGPAYEAAGLYALAADKNLILARLYAGEPVARPRLLRALCTYRQLGNRERAELALRMYGRKYGRRKPLPAKPCATLRPIAVPRRH